MCGVVRYPTIFQFTPLREGRPLPLFHRTLRIYFNSRPCVRGDEVPR